MNLTLHLFPYKYMEYETEFLKREIEKFLPNAECRYEGLNIDVEIDSSYNMNTLERLTFVDSFTVDGINKKTIQGLLESDDNEKHANKQFTRYSTNGLHEYKGKFNPQIVHSILNLLDAKHDDIVLDPFCGSGTTMLECAHLGIESYGIDINPFAVFLSNAKLDALSVDIEMVTCQAKTIIDGLEKGTYRKEKIKDDSRGLYLKKWIPEDTLLKLEYVRKEIESCNNSIKNFFTIVASDLIRDYSNQEPKDLRIRRRISAFPDKPFEAAFKDNIEKYVRRISFIQGNINPRKGNRAFHKDLRRVGSDFEIPTATMAITSPPYATALPYIDTQRLSLVWIGLISSEEIRTLEAELIGSREFVKKEKSILESALIDNSAGLPNDIYSLITEMKSVLNENDGFRKQAVPSLMYRYFSDMKESFSEVYNLICSKGKYALVVGHNRTKLGGRSFQIDTPKLLSTLAETEGWRTLELLPLQTYKRYGINAKNAITKETLIILERE